MPDHDNHIEDTLYCEQCFPTEKLIAELTLRGEITTVDDNELLERLEDVITYIVEIDAPRMVEPEVLIGHLTGAVYVLVSTLKQGVR